MPPQAATQRWEPMQKWPSESSQFTEELQETAAQAAQTGQTVVDIHAHAFSSPKSFIVPLSTPTTLKQAAVENE
ncbi:hypothetical protein M378DRAFT_1011188 [Amanita muscaria Koide BX008]|uniref:Uncharacterized protein n=1 Tax=Amanita muscaria (strain Koide BX008) TaxID=946122 RepID=A0A0C2WD94_AMAMK|nr:hypothetical protein M378DRAFT_1011188 [Amanita muscaria Koide BX008]